MANLLITVVILLLTVGPNVSIRTISIRDAATVGDNICEVVTVSLLVELHEKGTVDIKGITNDIITDVMKICNCTVIDSSVQCRNGDRAVYKLTLSQTLAVAKLDDVSTRVVMIQQCCCGNCTCDINSASSGNDQVMLILEIVCACLLLLVLVTISFLCYKCYRLCHQGEKVIPMTPCPAPLPSNSIRQCLSLQQQVATGSSEYIEPSEIVSPTFPPTLHHSNNHCSELPTATVMEQSTTIDVQLRTVDVQSTADMHSTICNMESITNTSTITQRKAHAVDSNGYIDRSIAREHQQSMISSLHGKIITPSGLVATIKVPTTLTEAGIVASELTEHPTANEQLIVDMQSAVGNTVESIANSSVITQQETGIISSEHYPGYVEHTIK